MNETPTPVIVAPDGKPARRASSACPRCGKGPQHRQESSGFGLAHPVCGVCGYEWTDEVWHG